MKHYDRHVEAVAELKAAGATREELADLLTDDDVDQIIRENGGEPLTYQQIGDLLGVTREAVRQMVDALLPRVALNVTCPLAARARLELIEDPGRAKWLP